jgi:hypothetical protein
MDLLAIKPAGPGLLCRHIEVQDSVNPISYLCGLPRDLQRELNCSPFSAKHRTKEVMEESVREWIKKKFRHPRKTDLRARLGPGPWREELVVNLVKFPEELEFVEAQGIAVHRLRDVVRDLQIGKGMGFTATGNDLINLLRTATGGGEE